MPPTSPLALPFLSSTLIKLICMEYLRGRTVERRVRGSGAERRSGGQSSRRNHPRWPALYQIVTSRAVLCATSLACVAVTIIEMF